MALPQRQGLYDPTQERDACGVGFIAHIKNVKSHEIVEHGLQILKNLEHRGATGYDPLLGDGAGGLAQPVNLDGGRRSAPRGAVATDLNKDGIPDLVVAGYGNNTLPVLLGKGDGTFEPVSSVTGPALPQSVDSADFNGDGIPDLVATTSTTGGQNVSTLLGQCK